MSDPVMDRPEHPWDDPDGDGHNCQGCPPESMWKCDEAAHPLRALAGPQSGEQPTERPRQHRAARAALSAPDPGSDQ